MKVILNKDLSTLGEEGDVKDVAKGYARNFLFPRGIALPYNEKTKKLFDEKRGEIEERKALKRQDAAGLKERLEALAIALVMPAGQNGKLYGAVTAQTIVDELAKQNFQVERKKIEIPGNTIKSVGKYKFAVKLYENAAAECSITIEGQPVKTETKAPAAPARRGRRDMGRGSGDNAPGDNAPKNEDASSAVNEPPETSGGGTPPETSGGGTPAEAAPSDTGNPADNGVISE